MNWTYSLGDLKKDKAYDIVKDLNGDIYVTGTITDSVNLNPTGTAHYINSINPNSESSFLAKYDKNFTLIWAFTIGSGGFGTTLLLDDSANVYVAGRGYGSIDFDPSSGSHLFDCSPSNAFIAKYDKNGNFKAVNSIPSVDDFSERSWNSETKIFIDSQRNLFTYSEDTLTKLDPSLQLVWKNKISGQPEFFNDSYFYAIREFKTPFYLEPSPGGIGPSLVLDKYDKVSGNRLSSQEIAHVTTQIPQTWTSICGGFIKKTKSGKLIVSGNFWGDMNCYGSKDSIEISNAYLGHGPGGQRFPVTREFIAQFDDAGNVEWAKAFGQDSPRPYMIETDDNGFIYTIGLNDPFTKINFSPDTSAVFSEVGGYISKYDSNFSFIAASTFRASYEDFISGFKMYEDTAVICGTFDNTLNFQISGSHFSLSAAGSSDFFVSKYPSFNLTSYGVNIPETDPISTNTVQVYPNPTTGIFNLKLDSKVENTRIRVYDSYGQAILTANIDSEIVEIDISECPNSLYTLIVTNKKSSTTIKVLKMD